MPRAHLIGTGLTAFGRLEGRSTLDLMSEAAEAALPLREWCAGLCKHQCEQPLQRKHAFGERVPRIVALVRGRQVERIDALS